MNIPRMVASGCGCGYFPVAPGTFASAVAILLGAPLLQAASIALPVLALLLTVGGLWAIAAAKVQDDPSWVVIDEFAGQFLALCGLAHASITGLVAAFALFRLLDITKPGPIGWADRQSGAAGVMADDVIAGIVAAGILWSAGAYWPNLFN